MTDPYAKDGASLRFHLNDAQTYRLYSVGPDGQDNQGQPIAENDWHGDGDYLLETLISN